MESANSPRKEPSSRRSLSTSWLWMALALGLPALLYLATLYPGPGGRINVGDSAKFQYIGEILGVPHEPGYPQYVVLNYLWTRLPVPLSLANQVNLLSAVLALAAGAFLFSTLRHLTKLPGVAVVGTWTVLLARSVWIFSTEAEVYSLHLLWVSALLWAIVHLLESPATTRFRWLAAAICILGFSFGNHPTAILLIPGFLLVVLGLDLRLATSPRVLAFVALVVVLSASQYGFLLWRSHAEAPFLEGIGKEATVQDLVGKVSGARFSTKHVLKKGSVGTGQRFSRAMLEIPIQLSWLTLILAAIGIPVLLASNRLLLGHLLLGALGPPVFVSFYQIGDWQAYLAPAFVSLIALAAMAFTSSMLATRGRRGGALLVWFLALAWTVATNYPQVRVEENPRDREALLEAAVSGDWVVTYPVNGYSFRQLNYYYRYGLHLEDASGIRIRTAPEIFEQDFAFLTDDRLLFSTQDVRTVFEEHRTDFTPIWTADKSASPFYVTGTRYPTRSVRISPQPGGRVSLLGPDDLVLAGPDLAIQVLVASPDHARIKGVASFPSRRIATRHSRWPLRDFLERIRRRDWVCVLLQGPSLARGDEGVKLVLEAFDLQPLEPAEAPEVLIIAGSRGSNVDDLIVLEDPREPVELHLRTDR